VPDRPLVSIIVPTLNEASVLPDTLSHLQAQPAPLEVVVADGGSSDRTRAEARDAGARVVEASRGRGVQMNRGAEAAEASLLLFLHADTRLPPDGLSQLRRTLTNGADAGIFRLQFDRPTLLLRLYAWCTRWPWIRLCFGDRGLFVTREAFAAVGGYPEWPLFEDLELAARLQEHGDFRFLDAAVVTSARRFAEYGVLRQQLRNAYLWTHYLLGTDPERLKALYPYPDDERIPSSPPDAS
jgi:rSAM/selenodomain-associated transferase 2